MEQHGCPITLAYLNELIEERQHLGIANAVEWRLLSLKDMAVVAGNSRQDLLMRSFLALEMMATRGLKADPVLGRDRLTAMRWPRSANGLALLLYSIRREATELCAEFAERRLLEQELVTTANDLRVTKQEWRLEGLRQFEAAAMLVRRSLKDTEVWKSLGNVGVRLHAVLNRSCGFDARVDIAHELLEQTSEVVRRAWEPRIQSVR